LLGFTPGFRRYIGGDEVAMQNLHTDEMIDHGIQLRLGSG
jgi:hypothetical protein